MDFSFETSGGFIVCFPIWMVCNDTGRLDGLVRAKHPDGEIGPVIFTDQDLGERFRDAVTPPGQSSLLFRIPEPLMLVGILHTLALLGNTHVIIDPGKRVPAFAIGTVRDHAAKAVVLISSEPGNDD
jgi:hypothetical protein